MDSTLSFETPEFDIDCHLCHIVANIIVIITIPSKFIITNINIIVVYSFIVIVVINIALTTSVQNNSKFDIFLDCNPIEFTIDYHHSHSCHM